MFGEGGYWPPLVDQPARCELCGARKHPGTCTGGHLHPDARTIDHVPAPKPEPVPLQPRGTKRNRLGLTENRQKPHDEDREKG